MNGRSANLAAVQDVCVDNADRACVRVKESTDLVALGLQAVVVHFWKPDQKSKSNVQGGVAAKTEVSLCERQRADQRSSQLSFLRANRSANEYGLKCFCVEVSSMTTLNL